ncbi:MAG TPA: hypothetical protein VG099_05740 [Gemmataceae bacterium]|jgi:hypothetical protein|nr:hypothetical protein [Gemmataceae bacterium]
MSRRQTNERKSRFAQALPLLLLLPVFGCTNSHPGVGQVSGTVKFKGQPLTSGAITWSIIFVTEDGQTTGDVVGKDGKYTVNEVATGRAKIAIVGLPRVPPGLVGPKEKPPTLDNASRGLLESLKKFENPDTSGLTFPVAKGKQPHDIELK